MLLNPQGTFNDLSPKLREELINKVRSFGKTVRYKFDISNENPDPQKYNGKLIWPKMYILDPATFYINDKDEDRKDKSPSKRIGLIDSIDEKGLPNKFQKIKVDGKYAGILKLDIEENPVHFDYAMYLELHPKLTNGKFSDKTKRQLISRIDEIAAAREARSARTERKKAMDAVESMSEKELIDFADAMLWDSTQDIELLRNQAEELAETNPVYFNEKTQGKTIEYQAVVKQAVDRGVILFDPADYSYCYAGNRQKITILSPVGDKNEVEKMADWLMVGGAKADEVFKKIKSLVGGKKEVTG